MDSSLRRDLRFLKIYALVVTVGLAALLFEVYADQDEPARFREIDVERINIVEQDGTLRMVLSNQARQHPGIVNGKVIERATPRPPGMIFFNHLGDEMGGLIFGENGGKGHFGSLTFDKVRNDQTIGFRHLESDDGSYLTGLEMWQRPNLPSDEMHAKYDAAEKLEDEAARKAAIQAMVDANELPARRLFLGKWRNDATQLTLHDIQGRPRIRLSVEADGTAGLEFLDDDGNTVLRLPGEQEATGEP